MKILSKILLVIFSVFLSISCEKENIPPTCEISSPDNGEEFDVGDIITISVEADDEDGTIDEVRFYIDDIGVGSTSSFPYNYEWDSKDKDDGIVKIKVSAKDDKGVVVEDEISILLNPGGVASDITGQKGTLTDIEGNTYNWVGIGQQAWMAENLKTTKYNDGTSIPLVTDATEWIKLTTPGYCWYDNDQTTYKDTYGALYNWYTVNTDILCPAGWHVPTDAEWTEMENYLIANGYNYDGTTTANKIGKSLAATSGWYTSSEVGDVGNDQSSNNATGFTALPGGYRYGNGYFLDVGYSGYWWSSTDYSSIFAYGPYLTYLINTLYHYLINKQEGFSVRCLRDN